MFTARGLLALALAASLGVLPALAAAQDSEDPCVCPVRGDRGGVSGLLGLAALGLARIGTGVRAFVAEPAGGPVLAAAPIEEAAPPVAAAAGGAPTVVPDTARDTTEAVAPQAAPVAPAAPQQVAMAATPDDQPLGVVAPRTATSLPLLALLGLVALLAGIAMLLARHRELAAAPAPAPRRRHAPHTIVLLGGRQRHLASRRIR